MKNTVHIEVFPDPEPIPNLFRPALTVISAITRTEKMPAMRESLKMLTPYFRVRWNYTLGKTTSIGQAWQDCVSGHATPGWIIILDDDNLIHPTMPSALHAKVMLNNRAGDEPLLLMDQVTSDDQPRTNVLNPERMATGFVDAAQFVMPDWLPRRVPFPDTNDCPDGKWAEAVKEQLLDLKVFCVPIRCYYNKNA